MGLETVDFAHLDLRPGNHVLDIGCGQGRHCISAGFHAPVQSIGMDPNLEDLEVAKRRFAALNDIPRQDDRSLWLCAASGLAIPFADASFDRVVCSEVLEHIPDYQQVLGEIRRVLKLGGIVAISVPRFGPEWICWKLSRAYHQAPGGHVRIFRSRQLRRAVMNFGMRPFARHWAHALHTPYWWLKCLFWDTAERNFLVRAYHRFLLWDLIANPRITRVLERLLNPLIGKSVVMYFVRVS